VCGSDYAYDFSRKVDETYARCRLCETRWLLRLKDGELVVSKTPAETRLLRDIILSFGLIILSLGSIITLLLNALLGMFLVIGGIVMTVMAVAPPTRKKKKVEKEPEEMQLCPQCNKEISKALKICPYCRFDLTSVCPSCGRRISPRFKLCPYCRERLKD